MMNDLRQGRILIVSNRLPVSVRKDGSKLRFIPSSGGLATGLTSIRREYNTAWIGWPGVVAKEDRRGAEERLISEMGCYPLFLSDQLSEKYYEGYCNRTIWPIFHSFPALARYAAVEWEAYKRVNQLFVHKILELYRPGDRLWIHDYHLMLLPKPLRDHIGKVPMGFFLHIPFPHHDIFRLMPQHREILESLLALDLIGFHTHDYAQAFLGPVRRLLGHDNTLGQLLVGDRVVQADVFPMGIDFQKYSGASMNPVLREEIQKIWKRMGSRKTVFKVTRLDYTKGIPESLTAIREFLIRYSNWGEKIEFVLVVVPSREKVERYATLKREIDGLVGHINSEFATLRWTPIRYIYRSLSFAELIGLYAYADIALVTPLRDGMNLIAKEYLAVKNDGTGVLVLSEMAGAAKELLEALLVNPNSKEDIADALHKALTMPKEEQIRRNMYMRQRLESHDIWWWGKRFLTRLREVTQTSELLEVKILDEEIRTELLEKYAAAAHRLIILDYDGTLVPLADDAAKAKPDASLCAILRKLSSSPRNHIVVLSGRDRYTLGGWMSKGDMTLVAEHGGWVKLAGEKEWAPAITPTPDGWKKEIRPIIDLFVDRIPGSSVEEKDFSLVWHYRKAESESGTAAARELLDTLSNLSSNLSIQVLPGNKTIEVRNIGISKGVFFTRFLAASAPGFILAMGDDWTDEDLFAVLPKDAFSVKVGLRLSKAQSNLKSFHDVRSLLSRLER
jgi:trehalose 6-phosphate synthase/phosphatase